MESISVKDIPQNMLIGNSLKEQLLGERKLKPTEAAEKNVLPSVEDVQSEKNHQNILTGKFHTLHTCLPCLILVWY